MLEAISQDEFYRLERNLLPYKIVRVISSENPMPYIEWNGEEIHEDDLIEGIFFCSHQDRDTGMPYYFKDKDFSYKDYFKFKGRLKYISQDTFIIDCSEEYFKLEITVHSIHMHISKRYWSLKEK